MFQTHIFAKVFKFFEAKMCSLKDIGLVSQMVFRLSQD